MLRTIIVRNDLIKGTLRKAIRTNITRSVSFECTKRRNRNNQPSLLLPNQTAPWRYNVLRFYASLPNHIKVPLPALSPTMEAGTIVSWSKKEGDKLSEGDLLCEIETDKATMGFETPEEGYLAKIIVPAGTKDVKIGALVCIIVENQADVAAFKDFKADAAAAAPAPAPSAPAAAPAPAPPSPPPAAPPAPAPAAPAPAAPAAPGTRVYASPLAKKLARDANIQLQGKGTGVYESITSKDLAGMAAGGAPAAAGGRQSPMAQGLAQAKAQRKGGAAPAPAAPAPAAGAPAGAAAKPSALKPGMPSTFVDIPISNIRSVIAKRLMESKLTIPHYYLTNHCNADKLIAMRKKFNKKLEKQEIRVSINDFIMKATACASMKVPEMNASWMGDKIRQYDNVDISLAVSTPTGLITPIIFNANGKGIIQISQETKELAKRARANKLQPHEYQGGTISVSNLGMFGTSQFCAIINPPQSAILAVGTNETRLIPCEDSDKGFRAAQFISFTLSADHRVVDGAAAATWLKAFREFIEDPESMIF